MCGVIQWRLCYQWGYPSSYSKNPVKKWETFHVYSGEWSQISPCILENLYCQRCTLSSHLVMLITCLLRKTALSVLHNTGIGCFYPFLTLFHSCICLFLLLYTALIKHVSITILRILLTTFKTSMFSLIPTILVILQSVGH